MPYAPLLGPEEVRRRLQDREGWELRGGSIVRVFRFSSYMDGIAFANRVADAAQAADHHPDMAIGYRRVTVTLTTHASHGLTHRDFDLAEAIDRLGR